MSRKREKEKGSHTNDERPRRAALTGEQSSSSPQIPYHIVTEALAETNASFIDQTETESDVTLLGLGLLSCRQMGIYTNVHNQEAQTRGYKYKTPQGNAFAIGSGFAAMTVCRANYLYEGFLPQVTQEDYDRHLQEKSTLSDHDFLEQLKTSEPHFVNGIEKLATEVANSRGLNREIVIKGAVFGYRLTQIAMTRSQI